MNTKNDTKIDLVIKNGSVIFPNYKTEKADIGISEGKICEIGSVDRSQANQVVDAKGLIVMPGAIDTQVHFREPGLTHKEDIHNGTKGAILGGITTVFEMPNTSPATINKEQLDIKLEIARKQAFCNYSFFIGAAKENIEDLSNLERLAGCCGVKIFMGASTGDLLVEDDDSLRKIISNIDRKFAVHSEDEYRLNTGTLISHQKWNVDDTLESGFLNAQRLYNKIKFDEDTLIRSDEIEKRSGLALKIKEAQGFFDDNANYFSDVDYSSLQTDFNVKIKSLSAIELFGYFTPDVTGEWTFQIPTLYINNLWISNDHALYDFTKDNADISKVRGSGMTGKSTKLFLKNCVTLLLNLKITLKATWLKIKNLMTKQDK